MVSPVRVWAPDKVEELWQLEQNNLDASSDTARCLSNSTSAAEEYERGRANVGDKRACGGKTYPRTCLRSFIPEEAPYERIKSCFRCCVYYWTETWGLSGNFKTLQSKHHLGDENNDNPFHHSQTEVVLSPNSIMKFADVAFTNHMYYRFNPNRERNGFVNMGSGVILDPDGAQRPCVATDNMKCVIRDGGVIMARRFFFDAKIFTQLGSWAKAGKNLSVLLDRDVAEGDSRDWKDLVMSSGLRVYRTNPEQQLWSFPLTTSTTQDGDGYFYPLGMSSGFSPDTLEEMLTSYRRTFAEKEELLSCVGIRVDSEPDNVMDHRKKVLDLLAPNFSCSSDKLTPDQFYKKLGTAKFALSPRGGGHNCYRTWEILALGSIPVLDYHPAHEELYMGLPTVQVKDWRMVTPEFLSSEWSRIMSEKNSKKISNSKAFLPYWIDHIYGRAHE